MGHKIFVSYKFADSDVRWFPGMRYLTARAYVDEIQKYLQWSYGDIYKGEDSDEDLSQYSDPYIWNRLKNRIYDSSITIVLISPNMKIPYVRERNQWIPWEISYSLCNEVRDGRTSHNNALLAVVLPDRNGSYAYYNPDKLFSILRSNIQNGYTEVVSWDYFARDPQQYIRNALWRKDRIPESILQKRL